MIQPRGRFRAFWWVWGWNSEESSQEIVLGWACRNILCIGSAGVNEVLMKSLFPMGCDSSWGDGDALGSECANAGR